MALSRLIHTDNSEFLTLRVWERPRRRVTEGAPMTADGKPARFVVTAHWRNAAPVGSEPGAFVGEKAYATRDEAMAKLAAVKALHEPRERLPFCYDTCAHED